MASQHYPSVSTFGHVRVIVWGFLIGSLLVALSLPLLTLWHAASSPITAHVCLWPPQPQAYQTVQVVVSVPDAADRGAIAGPWAHLHIAWDMVTMTMGTQPIDLTGTAEQDGTFSVPLRIDMAGPWWVELTLQTPGRPQWQTQVEFTAASSAGDLAVRSSSSGETTPAGCNSAIQERMGSL